VSRRPLEISIYTYERPAAVAPALGPHLSVRAARAVRSTVVASLCLLAHGLMLRHVMWNAGAPAPRPQYLPARISVSSDSEEEAMQWIALDPRALTDPAQRKPDLPSVHLRPIDVRKDLAEVAVLVPDADLPSTADATAADAVRLSKMYGRYVGQISSRIERAWLRPRTPIGAPSFSCQVRIVQDTMGNVREVTLVQCNGDFRWQLSLVQAIQSASPLPAPPDPDVFSGTLHMAFNSEAYSPEQSADQYEPEASARLVQAAQNEQRADEALVHPGDARFSGTIRLTITGDHKTVELQNDPPADGSPSRNAKNQ
jgi:hypothetical protein